MRTNSDAPSLTQHANADEVTTSGSWRLAVAYRWYVLGLLWCVALLRFVDLQILAVLLEPIKAEFLLTDTQLALLGGFAFALFYGLLGVPIAWVAERHSRRNIIAFAVSLWSVMTALCGYATGFATLFLARMGVGIGEAGAYPPSTSLLADYFPPQQRGRVYAILTSAIPIGVLTGFLVGGVVAQQQGWRMALQVVGLPGLLVGLLVYTTVAEPRRADIGRESLGGVRALWQQSKTLLQLRSYRHVVAGACLFTMGATGSGLWIPSFFIRHHGFTGAEIGMWMAGLYGAGGLLGSLLGGWLGEKFDRDGSRQMFAAVCQWSLLTSLPLLPFVFLNGDAKAALCIHFFVVVLMHMNTGPVLTLIQHLAGPGRRALAHAFSVLASNLIGLPLGPLFVGLFSDHFAPHWGSQTLGIAILVLLLSSWVVGCWHFRRAGQLLGVTHKAQ